MGYYDDYDDSYDLYEERLEPVNLVAGECTEKEITDVLMSTGIPIDRKPRISCTMEKLVFVYGNPNEVYSPAEIQFTTNVDKVYVYPEFIKFINRGSMICRVIVAEIKSTDKEALKGCVSFEKIANKALDGFNIFFFITKQGVFFGCKIFDKTGKHDCTLSKPLKIQKEFENILDELSFLTSSDDFMRFYEQYRQIITCEISNDEDYETMIFRKRGIQFSYLDDIDKLGKAIGMDMSKEAERYWHLFDEDTDISFSQLLEEVEDDLSFIKSNRINTYELLFEAEEMERQAVNAEEEREKIIQQMSTEVLDANSDIESEMETILDDPEIMIKFLKKRRGI